MQKFPLRMKDNDLLVTELYKDPNNDHITAISVYLTPKITSKFKYCTSEGQIGVAFSSSSKLATPGNRIPLLPRNAGNSKFPQFNKQKNSF